MMLSLHLKPKDQPTGSIARHWPPHMIYFQLFDIHFAIYATVTAILNAEHGAQEYIYISKSESETHMHFYASASLNNFRFSFSLLLLLLLLDFCSSGSHWMVVIVFVCVCVRVFFIAFFIHWIAKADSNRMNTKFTFDGANHIHTRAHIHTNDCSVVQMKRKQRQSEKI